MYFKFSELQDWGKRSGECRRRIMRCCPKYSIDHGCRGDVVFETKTDALAGHYAEDFHALLLMETSTAGPKRFMLADEAAWNLFSKFLSEEEPI